MKTAKELNGAWEERGVIGTRIEIDGKNITVLWRNSPVLTTTFKLKDAEGGTELELKSNGLRYEGSKSDYATVTRIFYSEGRLIFEEHFPITGPSKTELTKTECSRFGNYTVCDKVLKELQGKWKDKNGSFELEFKKDTLTVFGTTVKVHVLHSNSSDCCDDYIIADADPSHYELIGMSRLEYSGGVLSSHLLVCDAPPVNLLFTKVN